MIECTQCGELSLKPEQCARCGWVVPEIGGFKAWAPELAASASGFKAEYFELLFRLEEDHFWFRGRNRLIIWALQRYFPDAASLIEIGCGTGYVLAGVRAAFPAARLVGSEVFTAGLDFARRRVPGASFLQMDARRIPFVDEFDVVAAFDVLEHIDEDEEVLAQMFRALKPGGGLIVTVPQHRALWSAADDYGCHVRRYYRTELAKKIQAAGFEILCSTSFVTLLLPVMIASRLRHRKLATYDPLSELHLNRGMNRMFEAALNVERGLIRAGVRFPVGGSRLVVARKPGGSGAR